MKAPIPVQIRIGDATICNHAITSVMFSKTLNVFIYVIFRKLAANVSPLCGCCELRDRVLSAKIIILAKENRAA